MNLEAPSVWRIFAGNLKTITNMQKNLSRLTFISTLWHGNAQKIAVQSMVHRFSFYLCMKYNITNT